MRSFFKFSLPGMMLGIAVLFAAGPFHAWGQAGARAVETEFEYASRLIEGGFPDYAQSVMDDVVAEHPELADRARVIRAQALVAARNFEAAEKVLAEVPEGSPQSQAIRLAIADGYYVSGDYEASGRIYDEFFARHDETPSDPDILRFFSEAAYKYAQMQRMRDNPKGAAEAYGHVLRTIQDEELIRQVKVEQAELWLRVAEEMEPGEERDKIIQNASSNCREVLWGGMDLWFGRAVACLAQAMILDGRRDEAADLIRSNLEMLRKVDELIREAELPLSDSPLAGARSLLADLLRSEADDLMAEKARREALALDYFEKALKEYQAVWELIQQGIRRDDNYLKRYPDRTVEDLRGTEFERRKPIDDLLEALGDFHGIVDQAGGSSGWEVENRERVNKILATVTEIGKKLGELDRKRGVTPTSDMQLGERFRGREALERARYFLAPAEERRKNALRLYVQALQHEYQVYVTYSGSSWSREAGRNVDALKSLLENLTGQKVTIEVGAEQKRKMGLVLINDGRTLFRQSEYASAAERLLEGLQALPEGRHAVPALANLMECHARLGNDIWVRMLAAYTGERFYDEESAPQALLRIGRYYYDQKNVLMYARIYETYLENFPEHYAAPAILYMLGEQRWEAEDYRGAESYYRRVVENYPQSGEYLRALNRLGWSFYLREMYPEAAEFFDKVVERASPGRLRAEAKLCQADALRNAGEFARAIVHYRELAKWLSDEESVYRRTSQVEDRGAYREFLEQAVFFQGHCLSQIADQPGRESEYRRAAVRLYRDFVTRFPDSRFAPSALSSMGAVLLSDDQSEAAAEVFDELARRYPESEAGKNARFAMVRSLLSIGQVDRARRELRGMVAEPDAFTTQHFLNLGELFFEEEDYASALMALNQAEKTPIDEAATNERQRRSIRQRLLMRLGRTHFELGDAAAAAEVLTELIEQYPTSSLIYEARFLLAKAQRELGMTEEAIASLREIFRQSSDQAMINRATLELGKIQVNRGEIGKALASFQRIVLVEDPSNPEIRPLYEEALGLSVELYARQENWSKVVRSADQYLALFPSGERADEVRRLRLEAGMK